MCMYVSEHFYGTLSSSHNYLRDYICGNSVLILVSTRVIFFNLYLYFYFIIAIVTCVIYVIITLFSMKLFQ